MSGPKWVEGRVWATRPPGLCIFALAEGVTVESGGRLLIGLKLQRPETLVLLDEAVLTLPHPQGFQHAKMTPVQAREWAKTGTIGSPEGKLKIGEQLVAAFDHHALLYREALGRGPGIIVVPDGSLPS